LIRASVNLSEIAFGYASKRVDADQQRYDLGTISVFFLLSSQTDLTIARSNLVDQIVQYRRNVLNLQQRLGTLLADKGIILQQPKCRCAGSFSPVFRSVDPRCLGAIDCECLPQPGLLAMLQKNGPPPCKENGPEGRRNGR